MYVGEYAPLAVFLCSFPIPFLISLTDASCRTPMALLFFPPVGLLCFYVVVAFGPTDRESAGRIAMELVGFLILGSLLAVVAQIVTSLLLWRREVFSYWDADKQLLNCLEKLLHLVEGVHKACHARSPFQAL